MLVPTIYVQLSMFVSQTPSIYTKNELFGSFLLSKKFLSFLPYFNILANIPFLLEKASSTSVVI